jgi:hypothetical protein
MDDTHALSGESNAGAWEMQRSQVCTPDNQPLRIMRQVLRTRFGATAFLGHRTPAGRAAGAGHVARRTSEARPARVAPSEHRRAGAFRCLDDRTMAVPCPTRTARSGRRLEAQATQGRRHPRVPERGGARRAAGAIRRPSSLLVLDPFVRLHRIDENASGEVAPLLAYLRELQRRHSLAVLFVHHAKKSGGRLRAGQALRGSSEFHAWGDSNLYLRRDGPNLTLTVEHRAAPSMPAIDLELVPRQDALALEVLASTLSPTPASTSVDERITAALIDATQPLSISQLRPLCRVRNATLYARLTAMTATGHIERGADGYRIAAKS